MDSRRERRLRERLEAAELAGEEVTLLERARVKAGLEQVELAEKAGVSRQVVNNLERGRSKGYTETWVKLARALEVSLDEIVEPEGKVLAR